MLEKWKVKEESTGTVHRKGHHFRVLKQKKISQGHTCEEKIIKAQSNKMGRVLGRKIKNAHLRFSILKIKFT